MKNINKIIRENIEKYLIAEGLPIWKKYGCPFSSREDVNLSDWYKIGKINYNPYANQDFIDIWSNPQNYHEYALMMHKNNGIGRCVGELESIPSYALSSMEIFPEYVDSDASIPFLGEHKTTDDEEQHKIFMSKLNINEEGKVILQHNSNTIISDGVLSAGHEKQGYSKNSDFGWYSWATEKIGKDPSNVGNYTYYCLVDIDDIYDYQNNIERFANLRKAVNSKPYVAMYWNNDTDVIAVTSFKPTPIAFILDKTNGTKYDGNWNEL